MELKWQVNEERGVQTLVPGVNAVMVRLHPGDVLTHVTAELAVSPSRKMFFNGYQTWTHCPEYTINDKIRGINGLPRFGVKLAALDRFADYHFVHYPNRKGFLHGFSWCYFRDGEHYRLFASLDEQPGYTLFHYNAFAETLSLSRDCRNVTASAPDFHAFDLFYAEGNSDEVFDRWFDALGIHNAPPPLNGYCSWYNHYQKISDKGILDDLSGARRIFPAGDLFQIDDGWEPFVGDWDQTNAMKFPHGLKPIVDEIHEAGFKAGLWLAPFVCEKKSACFREHQDWLLHYRGRPWKNGPNWSGFYSLDIDHPGVQDYLKAVFDRVLNEWNFDLVKLDFLYGAAPFATGDHGGHSDGPFPESRAARMIRAMEFLRKCCGSKLILGCGVPVMSAFGLVDYCRVGPDVSLDWDDYPFMRVIHRERVSTRQSLNNTVFRRQLNGRAFGNDPDVFFLRDRNLRLSGDEKNYLAEVNALLGSMWLTSDDLNTYDETKVQRYRQLARLRDASDVRVDPDTLTIRYSLDGETHTLKYPHP